MVSAKHLFPFWVGPCGFYLGWLIYRNNMFRFTQAQLETVGERYARLVTALARHDPDWVEIGVPKYASTRLTLDVMLMETKNMMDQLEVLHWWRLSKDIRHRVSLLEAETLACQARVKHLKGEPVDLLKACLSVDLPPPPKEEKKEVSSETLSESALREVGERALSYLSRKFDLDSSIEIRIGPSSSIGVKDKQVYACLDPNESSMQRVLQLCGQAAYRQQMLRLYYEELWPEFQVVTPATPRGVMERAVGRYLADHLTSNVHKLGISEENVKLIEQDETFSQLDWESYEICKKDANNPSGISNVAGYVGTTIISESCIEQAMLTPQILSTLVSPL